MTQFARVQPQALELEEAVLGALLLDRDVLPAVIDLLKPEDFYIDSHRNIYQAIISLFNKTNPVDLLTVTEQLRCEGLLEKSGNAYYLVELSNRVASAANVEYHARIIKEKSLQRQLISIGGKIVEGAFSPLEDVFDLLQSAENDLFKLSVDQSAKKASSAKSLAGKVLINAERAMRQRAMGGINGVTSGLRSLDKETGGFQDSDFIVLAARPGMGKTALAINTIALHASKSGKPVAVFSLEMSETQLMSRILASESGVSSREMSNGSLHESDLLLIQEAAEKVDFPLYIDDTPAISPSLLRSKARKLKTELGIGLIIVDYLQLMVLEGKGNREQEISKISASLKALAKELDIPVIALSQLSRAVETRGGSKRPILSDLRDSGSIEQDADMVMFLYRPEYYDITEDGDGNSTKGLGEIIIAKHRNGALNTVLVNFEDYLTRFSDIKSPQFPATPPVQNAVPDWSPNAGMPATRSEPLDVPF